MRFRDTLSCLALLVATGCDDAPQSTLLSYAEHQYEPVLASQPSLREAARTERAKAMNAANIARDNALAIHDELFTRIPEIRKLFYPDGRSQATHIFPFSNGWYHVEARTSKEGKKSLAIFTYCGVFQNRSFSYDGFPQALDGIADTSTNDVFPGMLIDAPPLDIYQSDLRIIRELIERRYSENLRK